MPAIDGLRAVAVAAVFLYHADAAWLPGGFFGVDVFFVISGYLITSLLLAESVQSGTVALLRFWAGRARRLLPALFTLLAVCMLVGATVERGRLLELRGDALVIDLLRRQLALHLRARELFRPVRAPAAAAPPVVAGGRGAVLPDLAAALPARAAAARGEPCSRSSSRLGAIGSTVLMWVLYTPGSDTSRVFYGTDTRAAPILVGALLAFLWKPSALPDVRNRVRARLLLETAGVLGLAGVTLRVHRAARLQHGDLSRGLPRGLDLRGGAARGDRASALLAGPAVLAATSPAGSASEATASTCGTGPCSPSRARASTCTSRVARWR